MRKSYLEVTFRNGKPLAGYVYLPRLPGDLSVRTEKRDGGLIVDYAADGRPIGIEITSPHHASLAVINEVISRVDEPASFTDMAPLGAVA